MKAAGLIERRRPLVLTDLPDPVPGAGEVVAQGEAEGIYRTVFGTAWCGDCHCLRMPSQLPGAERFLH
jgi:hypothetical protein